VAFKGFWTKRSFWAQKSVVGLGMGSVSDGLGSLSNEWQVVDALLAF